MKLTSFALTSVLLFGCSVAAPELNATIIESNISGPFFIQRQDESISFQFQTKQCAALGISLTEQAKLTVPASAICPAVDEAGGTIRWMLRGIGDLLGSAVRSILK